MAQTAHKSEEEKKEYFDSPEVLDEKVTLLAEMVLTSSHFVAFTGAGISTACGIPDYRSGYNTVLETGPGCWESAANKLKYKEEQKRAAAAGGVKPKPEASKATLRTSIQKAYPSLTHMAMVELTERNHLKYIVSQNVDGLHRKSGIPAANIAELHGNTNLEVCELCNREYMRDHRVRNAQKTHDHRTGRMCESPGCNGHLKDTIINFNENLNPAILELGEANCESADLCLAMGSSLRVSPANGMPEACAINGGRLVICNLQKTPLDGLATLVIHAKCDDIMKLLMQKLGYQIPTWQMKKRIEVSLQENGTKVRLRGVDDTRQPFHLFKKIKVSGLAPNATRDFPSAQQKQQPYTFKLPEQAPPEKVTLNLEFMGHYEERPINIDVNIADLQAHESIVYEMVMDSQTGVWELVVMQDQDRNMIGVAEFSM